MIVVPDTHALAWFCTADPHLSSAARAALTNPSDDYAIPAIVLAEAEHLYRRGKFVVGSSEILAELSALVSYRIVPLDQDCLPYIDGELDLHDSWIVAAALLEHRSHPDIEVAVVSRDRKMKMRRLVKVVW